MSIIVYLYVKPLFPYYFLLIAMMTKAMSTNSQQLLIIMLFLCEVITINKINMNFCFFLFFFSFLLFTQDHSKKIKPLTQHLSLLYSSRTRLHREIIRQNSKLDHAINFILLDQNTTNRIVLRKTVKIGVVIVIRYRGTSPKLGSCQGECPYPYDYVSFAGAEDGGDDR